MTVKDILWLIFEISLNLFHGFAIIWFLNRVLDKKKNVSRWSSYVCSLCYALCCTTYLFFPMPENDTWMMIAPFVYTLLCMKNTLLQKFFWNIIAFLCITGTSYFLTWLMETLFQIDFSILVQSSLPRLIFAITGNLVIFILYLIIPRVIKSRLTNLFPMSIFVAIVILLLLVGDAQFAIYAYAERSDFLSQFSGALVLIITVLTIILYFIMSNYAQEAAKKKLLETKINQEAQRMDDLLQVSNSLHALRHDLLDQLHIAADLMKKGNTSEGDQYLAEIESRILHIFSTGCHPLDSALYMKQQKMEQHGIIFHSSIDPIESLPVTAYELCTIVINLLDNAIEAAERFPAKPENYTIMLSIHRQAKMLFIECTNPVWEPSLIIKDGQFITSKSESGHGKGLAAIEKILVRADAQSYIRTENRLFKVLIGLPYWGEIDADLPHGEAVKQHNAILKEHAKSTTRWARFKREWNRRRSWRKH